MLQGSGEQIVVLAPVGRDGRLVTAILQKSGIDAVAVPTMELLREQLESTVGALVVAEEAFAQEPIELIVAALESQPPWSDVPLIILTRKGPRYAISIARLMHVLEGVGNISLLERPLRSITLVSAVQVALRSRRRQYEVRSLTENLEKRVADRTLELQRLNDEAAGFAYSISHDLRTPLRAIVATSKTLLYDHGPSLSAEIRSDLERQASAATRMAILIDDLLSLSRLSRQDMVVKEFDLSVLAHEVLAEILRDAPAKCTWDIQPSMHAVGDPTLLRFVLLNLMHNACKFSPQGGEVKVGRFSTGEFFVQDEGIGFDMQYAYKIFLPFERLVRDSEFPGTGIGLANTARIIQRHGGTILAKSEPGKGSLFTFTLPGS